MVLCVMSIGFVMFWKAVALTIGALILEKYRGFKRKRRGNGALLRYNPRRRTYSDPFITFERRLKAAAWVIGSLLAVYTAFLLWVIFSGQMPAVMSAG